MQKEILCFFSGSGDYWICKYPLIVERLGGDWHFEVGQIIRKGDFVDDGKDLTDELDNLLNAAVDAGSFSLTERRHIVVNGVTAVTSSPRRSSITTSLVGD